MFPLAFLAAPLIQNVLGNALGGLFISIRAATAATAITATTMARASTSAWRPKTSRTDMQKFQNGDYAGAREEFREGMSRLAQGPGPVLSERTTQHILAAEDRKDAFQDFSRGQCGQRHRGAGRGEPALLVLIVQAPVPRRGDPDL